jgi:hypothetical protein
MDAKTTANVERAMALADELLKLAEKGEQESPDDRCLVLFGIVRDCAHTVRRAIERGCDDA